MNRIDYRCRGVGCCIAATCRRYMTGEQSTASTADYAAFDHRREGDTCDGYLPRIMAPIGDVELNAGGLSG